MTKIIKNELYRINKKILGSTSTIGDILFCVGQADKRYVGVYVFFNLRTGKQLVLSGKENVIESLRSQ